MADHIRIIRHEAVPKCGSFEVRFADGRESRFFYWDDLPSRRVRPEAVAVARQLRRKRPKGGQRSLRDVAAELAQRGHLNEQGRPFSAASVRSMLVRPFP